MYLINNQVYNKITFRKATTFSNTDFSECDFVGHSFTFYNCTFTDGVRFINCGNVQIFDSVGTIDVECVELTCSASAIIFGHILVYETCSFTDTSSLDFDNVAVVTNLIANCKSTMSEFIEKVSGGSLIATTLFINTEGTSRIKTSLTFNKLSVGQLLFIQEGVTLRSNIEQNTN